jgi:hypothetical protein
MRKTLRGMLLATVTMVPASLVNGQDAESLPAPREAPANQAPAPVLRALPPPPSEYGLPPIEPPGPFCGDHDPLLEEQSLPPPGWFAEVDATVGIPHVNNRLVNSGVTGTLTDVLHVPGAGLDWTVTPRFQVGYRLPHGFGEFSLAYWFLASAGSTNVLGDHVNSRLDWNELDLDYSNRLLLLPLDLPPLWETKWTIGFRLASVYFDARATIPAGGGAVVDQSAGNFFEGVGPHAGFELVRRLEPSGLAVYGKVDLASLYAHIHQHFEESGAPGGGIADERISQGTACLGLQVGVRWVPPKHPSMQFYVGYRYEEWWQVGRNDDSAPPGSGTFGSVGDVWLNGIIFRAQFEF